MSWQTGNGSVFDIPDQIEYFKNIQGDLPEEMARIELYKFLRSNLRVAAKLFMGIDLYPMQEIALKTFFKKDFTLAVCTRGFSKTTLGGIFAALYAMFVPNTNILLIGPSFRQSKLIFEHIEKRASSEEGIFLRECFNGDISHKNDENGVKIGSSEIKALPLGLAGDKIRGFRANVVVIDEYREVPPDIIKEVLKPFLIVNRDPRKTTRIIQMENELIRLGKMTEKDRTKFEQPKIIGLSSASYKVEHLSKTFDTYLENILDEKKKSDSSYAVVQISYRAIEEGYMNQGLLQEGRETMSQSQFDREYGAQFTDDSGSYFNMAQMEACSLQIGEYPTIQLRGHKDARYVLGIDPNYKENETSDHFAMCVIQLSEDGKKGTVVHNYAVAGLTLKDHVRYLHYILTNFNIVYIIGDGMGLDQVLSFANDNELFKSSKIELKKFESSYETAEEIASAKRTYNKANYSMVHVQNFTSGSWIQNANQYLQASFQHKRVLFGANLHDEDYKTIVEKIDIPIKDLNFDTDGKYKSNETGTKMIDMLDNQTRLIRLTKDECSQIEIGITSQGHQSFDLPQNLRRITGSKRPRKDSYTALLLSTWGIKCFQILTEAPPPANNTFTPFMIG